MIRITAWWYRELPGNGMIRITAWWYRELPGNGMIRITARGFDLLRGGHGRGATKKAPGRYFYPPNASCAVYLNSLFVDSPPKRVFRHRVHWRRPDFQGDYLVQEACCTSLLVYAGQSDIRVAVLWPVGGHLVGNPRHLARLLALQIHLSFEDSSVGVRFRRGVPHGRGDFQLFPDYLLDVFQYGPLILSDSKLDIHPILSTVALVYRGSPGNECIFAEREQQEFELVAIQRYIVEAHSFTAPFAASFCGFEILVLQLVQAFWLIWHGRRIRLDCHDRYFLLVSVGSVVRREGGFTGEGKQAE